MGAVAVDADAEQGLAHAFRDTGGHGPLDRLSVPFVGVHILEGILRIGLRLVQITPQEGDGLGTVGFAGGIEGGGRGSRSDTLRVGPQHCVVIPLTLLHIGKGIHNIHHGRTGMPPQHRDDLSSQQITVGVEGGLGGTVGDTVLHSPLHGIKEEVTGLHILKEGLGGGIAAAALAVDEVVAQSGDDLLSNQSLAADRTLLALGQAGFGASGSNSGDDLLGVTQSGNNLLGDQCLAADRTLLTLGQAGGSTGGSNGGDDLLGVAQSGNNLLGDQSLAADGALLALGQAGLGAGGSNSGDNFLGVTQSGNLLLRNQCLAAD